MPVAVHPQRGVQLVRDPKYFGIEKKEKRKQVNVPWVDVSDDDSKKPKHQQQNGMKRKNLNGNAHQHNDHYSNSNHRNKRRRQSNAGDSQHYGNGAPASPTSSRSGETPAKKANGKAHALAEQRKQLPIATGKDAIIEVIRKHDVTVVLGETGSGKTTQVPQYILESGIARNGMIAVTQPRRVAATSLAHRVASEQNVPVGGLVGYAVRFDEKNSETTRIKYLTDGMIMRELMSDPMLSSYSVVVVDEAHERTLRTDLLMANLKSIQRQRNTPSDKKGKGKADAAGPLKIVIMSATLDAEKFSKFYDNAKIVYVRGRQHEVKIYHSAKEQADYTEAALRTFFQIHLDSPPGDVLIFLPGQEDIESLKSSITMFANKLPVGVPTVVVRTMFAAQDNSQNTKAFEPTARDTRKVILATNIAETSITIPGIKYVIDTGKCKEKQYLAKVGGGGFDTLFTRDITKSSAMQRTGRAGREGPGVCFRLYTEEAFKNMSLSGEPEILRCSLTSTILTLKTLGQDLANLELMDKPDNETIASALKTLWLIGAIANDQKITDSGRQWPSFPLEPQYSCAIVASKTHGCTAEVLDIVSILSASSKLFLDVSEQREAVSDARQIFRHSLGDHLTILNAVRAYREIAQAENKHGRREWCRKHFLNERTFNEARDIREQLVLVCKRLSIDPTANVKEGGEEFVVRSFGWGWPGNSAFLQPDGSYKQTMGQSIIKIHPSSTMMDKKVPAIIYDELVYTNQVYARGVSSIPKAFFLTVPAFKKRKA